MEFISAIYSRITIYLFAIYLLYLTTLNMFRIESKTVSIMEDKELSKLLDVVNTVLANGEAPNNSLEDLESNINYEKIQTSCTKDISFVTPGHHDDLHRSTSPSELYRSCSTSPIFLYKSCHENMYDAEVCSTSPNVIYKSCHENRNDQDIYSSSPHEGLYISCAENKYVTDICSPIPDQHSEVYRSYGEVYGSCEANTQQNCTSFDEDHIDIYSSCQDIPTTFHITHRGSRCTRYQDMTPSNTLNKQRTIMNQVQKSLASLRLEIKRYQDILFGIKDGIVQVNKRIVDNPLSLNKEVRRNKITKYHKFRRALASSENLMRLTDGGAISTWPMDEWLVVEKVRSV